MVDSVKVKNPDGKDIIVRKGEFKKIKDGIAKVMKVLGYSASAREIKKHKTAAKVKREVDFHIIREFKSGRFGKYLYDPVTRKRMINPLRKKALPLKKQLDLAIKLLQVAERLG